MRLALTILGRELIVISTEAECYDDEPGDCVSQPIGFIASPGDQRWESSPQFVEYE